MRTEDGGQSWLPAEYAIHPAPWTYLSILLGLGLLVYAQERPSGTTKENIRTELLNDEPLDHDPEELLSKGVNSLASEQARLANGLARFLLNTETRPGLTLAITGTWGQGKSSVMKMLCRRLKRAGYFTAWFNAWHHQIEGRQLVSMLHTIRMRAVPPFHHPVGMEVRLRLLWSRGLPHRLLLVFPLVVGILTFNYLNQPQYKQLLYHVVPTLLTGEPPVILTPQSFARMQGMQDEKGQPIVCAALLDMMKRHLSHSPTGNSDAACKIKNSNCIFSNKSQLLDTIEQRLLPEVRGKCSNADQGLTDQETKIITQSVKELKTEMHGIYAMFVSVAVPLFLIMVFSTRVYRIDVAETIRNFFKVAVEKEPVGTVDRYRREFHRLTTAMQGRLVLFIDDLDRCECTAVREVMEHINYLVGEGKCHVVMAMAMQPVIRCLQERGNNPHHYDDNQARAYLRKIVHIEIPVPVTTQGQELLAILSESGQTDGITSENKVWKRTRKWLEPAKVLFTLSILAVVMIWGENKLKLFDLIFARAPEVSIVQQSPPDTAGSNQPQTVTPPGSPQSPKNGRGSGKDEPVVGTKENQQKNAQKWAMIIITLVLLLVILLWPYIRKRLDHMVNRLKPPLEHLKWLEERLKRNLGIVEKIEDPDSFRRALEKSSEIIDLVETQPRGLKRFLNRLRLIIALAEQKGLSNGSKTSLSDQQVELLVGWSSLYALCKTLPSDPNALCRCASEALATRMNGSNKYKDIKKYIDELWTNSYSERRLWDYFYSYMKEIHVY